MHDPMAVAHEIYLGPKKKKNGHYRSPFITIWHVDPEKDGTDDSCGWFIRERHMDKKIIEKVVKEFTSEWDNTFTGENGYVYNTGWFNPEGDNMLSVRGIVLNMYIYAAKIVFDPDNKNPTRTWKKAWKFVNNNYAQIMYFAENNRDSIRQTILRVFQIGCNVEYTKESRENMIRDCAKIVATDIARKTRPWYKHPRWHIHHWRIQLPVLRNFIRKYFTKCSICGKRGFGNGPAFSDWNGTKIWCEKCEAANRKEPVKQF